jgi:deazaflavin-dependent oxidoreductase (nitroreductase family)
MRANDFVAAILRSPFHALVGPTLLITVCGRRTGKPITTPVNYVRGANALWVLTSRDRQWWRNILPGSRVKLHVRGRDLEGTAELVTDESLVAAQLGEYVLQLPAAGRALGIPIVDGVPRPQDCERLAVERLFVKVRLQGRQSPRRRESMRGDSAWLG